MNEIEKIKEVSKLKKNHLEWREENFRTKHGFFPVFKDFKKFLNVLSPGATALFLYLGLHSDNLTGESKHSIEKMAKYFKKSSRTISSWLKELESHGLIERVQIQFNGVSHTFIKPYSNIKNKSEIEDDLPF